MACQIATSSTAVKRRNPALPQILPQTQQDWAQFIAALSIWQQSLESSSHSSNIVPSQYATFAGTSLPPFTVSGLSVSLDATYTLYSPNALKVSVSAAPATLQFQGLPIQLPTANRWACVFSIYTGTAVDGKLEVIGSAGADVSETFSVPASTVWKTAYGLFDLRAHADTTATWKFTFNEVGTYWIDGLQMVAIVGQFLGIPPFVVSRSPGSTDQLSDGSTYGRTVQTALTSGQPDLSKAGVINKTADQIAETTGRKWAAESGAQVVTGKSIDILSDGTTFARTVQTALTSGQPDLSKAGVINRTLDYIGDTGSYSRIQTGDTTGNRIDFSKGLLNKHLGNIPDDIASGRLAKRLYQLPDTSGSAQWVKLGTWINQSSGGSGKSLSIELSNGVGFNTGSLQQAKTLIIARSGNATLAPNLSGVSYYTHGGSSPVQSVKFYATGGSTSATNNSWDVYVLLAPFSGGYATVEVSTGDTFIWSGAGGQVDPGAASTTVVVAQGGQVLGAGGTGLDAVLDGPNYGRTVQTALTSGQPDLSKAGVINKTADQIAETTGRKWAAESGAQVVTGKSIDILSDGTTYARTKGAFLQSGRPYMNRSGKYIVANGGFEQNAIGASGGTAVGAPICDGWRIGQNTGNWSTNQESSTTFARSGTHDLYMSYRGNSVTIAANSFDEIRDYSDNFDVHPGDTIYVSGWWRSDQNAALPAGVTATSRLAVFFFDSSGATLGYPYLLLDEIAPMDATYRQKTGSIVVPSVAATAVICCGAYLTNTNSTPVTMPSTGLVADIRFDDVYGVLVSSLDSDVTDGTTYGRTVQTALTSGQPDMSKAGVINRTLDYLSDAAARKAVSATDVNARALIDMSQGGHVWRGSTPPTSSTANITYTSTDSSLTFSWPAFTLYWPDGTTTAVASGSQQITGLTASTTYYFYPYYDLATATVQMGSPYTAPSNAGLQLQTRYDHVPLTTGSYRAATAVTGGSGGGGPPACLHEGTPLSVRRGGKQMTIPARDLDRDDALYAPGGYQAVLSVCSEQHEEWLIVSMDNGQSITVTPTQPFLSVDGDWIRAHRLKVGDRLHGECDMVSVVALQSVRMRARKIIIGIPPPHAFYCGGVVVHNGTVKP